MTISFACPMSLHLPCGGLRVLIEHANHLAARKHRVYLVAAYNALGVDKLAPPHRQVKRWVWFVLRQLGYKGGYKPTRWISLHPDVRLLWRPSLHHRWIPDADAVIATTWEACEYVAQYPPSKGKKFYLIQGPETHLDGVDPDRVERAWRQPLTKLVVANWLQDLLASMGEPAYRISIGIDSPHNPFRLLRPIEERSPTNVLMLYHTAALKGSKYGLETLQLVKARVPELAAQLFGIVPPPPNLPSWMRYAQNPSQEQLCQFYNDAAIFIAPNLSEGLSLTPIEAMQCGATVCLTDIPAHHEYAEDGKTALFAPPKDSHKMAEQALRLIRQPALRIALAKAAYEHIRTLTWARAVERFEQCLRRETT